MFGNDFRWDNRKARLSLPKITINSTPALRGGEIPVRNAPDSRSKIRDTKCSTPDLWLSLNRPAKILCLKRCIPHAVGKLGSLFITLHKLRRPFLCHRQGKGVFQSKIYVFIAFLRRNFILRWLFFLLQFILWYLGF